jgi:surface antigen
MRPLPLWRESMSKPIKKSALLPAGVLLAALAAAPANASPLGSDGTGSADHIAVKGFQVADGRGHGRWDDDDGWRGHGRDHWRGPDRRVIVVRPGYGPGYYYPPPAVVYAPRPYPRPYVVAPATGFVAGLIVGGILGSYVTTYDNSQAAYVLENNRIGYRTQWTNPDTGYNYAITPTRTYQTESGQYCREYTTWGRIGGREQQLYGNACRMPDGSWQLSG